MAGNFKAKEDVLFLSATADIVQHQGHPAASLAVADNADMGQAASQIPGDNIARTIARGILTRRQRPALALEPGHQVWHAAMINIAVGPAKPPVLGIQAKVSAHVLMHRLLQIQALLAQRADHHIGAHAGIERDIAIGVTQAAVSRVITQGYADLLAGRCDQGIGLQCLGVKGQQATQ